MTSTDRGTVTRWSLLLPDAWSRIRLDHRRPQQVSAVVAEAFATVSRDQAVSLRRGLEAELNALAEKAAAEGGRELYLLSDVRRGLPLAATALVSVLPETLPAETPPELLAQVLAGGAGDEPTVVTVAGEQ